MKRALQSGLKWLAASLLLMLTLLGALWVWSGTVTSLPTLVNQLLPYLPAGQTLVLSGVTGSVRGGGHINALHWSQGDLRVAAHDVQLDWSLLALLEGELRMTQLSVQTLHIEDLRAASEVSAPPTGLSLPIQVITPFSVAVVSWNGVTTWTATGLTGNYKFDSYSHKLDVLKVNFSSGEYKGTANLQAQPPMAMAVQAQGTLRSTLPNGLQPITVNAQASLIGALAGPETALLLQAQLLPAAHQHSATQASLRAQIRPWQTQPLQTAQVQWQSLDLAALWPLAPETLLSGAATVTPAGAGWQASVALSNKLVGPWDQKRLPLQRLNAELEFVASQWRVKSLQATGAGGTITGKGGFNGKASERAASTRWQGSASLIGINPAAIDSRWGATRLNGQISTHQQQAGLEFDARFQTTSAQASAPHTAPSLYKPDLPRIKNVHAQGQWSAPMLKLEVLQIDTDEAQLEGALSIHATSQAMLGRLNLQLPGAQVLINGDLAPASGQGMFKLQVTDADSATRWFNRSLAPLLGTAAVAWHGSAEFSGQWQGGWQAMASDPQKALALSLQGQLQSGSRRFAWQTQAHGGRLANGNWQAQLNSAQLTAQDSALAGVWALQLRQAVAMQWQADKSAQTLDVGLGSASLSGPVPGTAFINWQAAQWSQQGTQSHWQTQGRAQDLPLAWLELLGQTKMAKLGLHGDMLLAGQWDAVGDDSLHLRADLTRTSGDLLLQTDGMTVGNIQAGVREARLAIRIDAEQIFATVRWDSERAGKVQADLNSRLQHVGGNWLWAEDAALAGSLNLQLPPVGVWSLLAPPGWRLRGTLNASAELSGTRSAPQWRGQLQAQDLAVRSVAEGVDFSQGTLRASLAGQRLVIDEFSLLGAGGQAGGQLVVKGGMEWQAATGLQLDLTAQARTLRVSTRADQRLVVSGDITALLRDAHLDIQGALKADSALLILPEDSAPELGRDVVVRQVNASKFALSVSAESLKPASGHLTSALALTLDPGSDFQVRGRGISTRLAGSLVLRTTVHEPAPNLSGALRTVRGSYKAYGQQLDIEQGLLRFSGSYNNPAVDILAIRPNLTQRVGVQISGSALSPLLRLYAEPDLPDAEKLAWLVLGRSAANGGAEAAVLQQAALALLGGNGKGLSATLAEALGLDEVSVRGAASTDTTTAATVTLGKRLSRDFYVAYEHSLAGTLGTFYVFYDLSRRFTLRAQAGEQSAIDLIFTLRHD